MIKKEEITEWFKELQDNICASLERLDGVGDFKEDKWNRPEGGGGRSRVILGDMIEKGGVNFSAVHGDMPEKISAALGIGKNTFFATGVSIVLHPRSPMMPIIHMNVRYFETNTGRWWFGGGIDLTPHYVVSSDAQFFHQYLKDVCDKSNFDYYPKFKTWADDYFFIKHRNETRGIGGIFFDRLSGDAKDKSAHFEFVKNVGNSFVPIYSELAERNRNLSFDDNHTKWQKLRRGRYVEFNLVWDKGTKFGLDTNGRTESILMSMPPQANWIYSHRIVDDSEEDRTQKLLKKGIDWVNYTAE